MTKLYCIRLNGKPVYIGRTEKHLNHRLEEHIAQSANLLTDKDEAFYSNYKNLTIELLCESDDAKDDETFIIWALHQHSKDDGFTTFNTTIGDGFEPVDKLKSLPTPTLAARVAATKLCGGALPKFVPWDGRMVEKTNIRLFDIEVVSNTTFMEDDRCRYHSGGKDTPNIKFRWLNSNRPGACYKTNAWTFIDTLKNCKTWKKGERYLVATSQCQAPDGKLIWAWHAQEKVDNSWVVKYERHICVLERLNRLQMEHSAVIRAATKEQLIRVEDITERLEELK